ncbi:MAG: TIGR02221 family CRISPR-associated protein [Scytonema sp. PMC 1069.18]|nr:TIGR02221 family CRISPR-associated protein [Scytonema sp. PMC 1069.18]MEC4884944.1 TIGR02221 family CRISPR-associated protein [Scytonema sp. PMC 1070.18]
MAKILISPIGVGGRFKNAETHDREYLDTVYKIQDKSYPKSRFMASVLYEHFDLDGIIFIGTVKSMWEEVYRFFCQKNKVMIEEDYWYNLAITIDSLNHESELQCLNLSKIRTVIGSRSECILIKYGLNESELWENFERIIKIVDFLQKGDKLYIDITHSFRSLSLFLFLALTFINDLVAEKEIEIVGVYYGMLDISRELGYTPVVDLKPLFDMTSWIKGAYSLKSYGDGHLIAKLLKAQGEEKLASQIEQLSEAVNLNYVTAIKQRSSTLKNVLQTPVPNSPFSYLRENLEDFVKKFARSSAEDYEYQLELAGWYFDNKRYATGYITLTEAIVTYLCDIHDKDPRSEELRNEMKDFLLNKHGDSKLAMLYRKVNSIRISVAHALLEQKRNSTSDIDAINNAKLYQQEAQRIFKTKTLSY